MRKKYTVGLLFLTVAVISSLALGYVFTKAKSTVDEADIKLVSATPLESKASRSVGEERVIRPDEADAVSEKIALSLIGQLRGGAADSRKLADSLLECSAIHVSKMQGDKSSCFNNYSGEAKEGCLVKRGIGKKSVGQILAADRFDLNADGIADYLISDRYYCHDLSANQANVYFVMLSTPKGDFHLAYADWASYGLQVVKSPSDGANILIERAPKVSETYSRVMQLVNGKFVQRTCILEDKDGYSRCDNK